MSSRKSKKSQIDVDPDEVREQTQALIDHLKDDSVKLFDQIVIKKESMSKFDDKLAALLVERNWYLRVLENLAEVAEREPELSRIQSYLEATPEELIELQKV
ncbi:hypothetical protein TRFO_17284 [Tritrichomonas foetus]|uniref:Uncharacterized protein n=1 Tax=Tritrichomonas foetus TaxID=1144522 RepID=A0A1J4KNJ1_9EUKA|nr:hypothetical protein TRFO_17284 [Tritrichomonas foetus]|eukprot:OHT12811.1 hypothetical protein TRFO_17284 [Tritrichomonas foetus]